MVAISLYKGNLHKVPDVPRRWPPLSPKISLKDFKILLRRRATALSRLRPSAATSIPDPASDQNPRSDPIPKENGSKRKRYCGHDDSDNHQTGPQMPSPEDLKDVGGAKEVEVNGDALVKLVEKSDAIVEGEKKNEETAKDEVKTEVLDNNTEEEERKTEDARIDKEERRKEIEEKLEILNERKHNLVQILKQILSAEEQLKRQNSLQGTSGRPPLPLQVDTTTDTGSMSRVNTPKIGPDGVPSADVDGGEADDVLNHHNILSRNVTRMSSTSPSSDSQQRKPPFNMVPLTHRTSLGVASSPSPSRFAPAGQGHSSVSVSGTSYIASSPSPAASGGTSIFRDGRLLSPWN